MRSIFKHRLLARRAQYLSDLLGDEHDLAVTQQTLAQHPARYTGIRSLPAFNGFDKTAPLRTATTSQTNRLEFAGGKKTITSSAQTQTLLERKSALASSMG